MSTVIIPFRGPDAKRRLEPLPEPGRRLLADAMLADVAAVAGAVARHLVVSPQPPALEVDFLHVADPTRGQGLAVRQGLDADVAAGAAPPFLIVNADLPWATPR